MSATVQVKRNRVFELTGHGIVLHVLLIIVFAAIAGSSGSEPVHPPQWAWFVLAGLVLIALVVLAIPAGRRVLRARLSPMLGQVLPRLPEVAQHPAQVRTGGRVLEPHRPGRCCSERTSAGSVPPS